MKNNTETVYIRLLKYNEACEIIKYYNDKYDKGSFTHAFITSGGVCLQGFAANFKDIHNYLSSKDWRFEMNVNHPMETQKQILKRY